MTEATDYCGDLIDQDEADDAEILVWQVTPHPTSSDYDSLVERSWHRLSEIMEDNIVQMIETPSADDMLHFPLVIEVQLKKMRKDEYESMIET